jgi:hypothetical protein
MDAKDLSGIAGQINSVRWGGVKTDIILRQRMHTLSGLLNRF